MKTTTIALIILLILILGGAVYYFAIPKDKCANVNCSEGKECNSNTGKCEISQMDIIEQAVDNTLQSSSGMDKIEQAINDKLGK